MWKAVSNVSAVDIGQVASTISKGFSVNVQAVKERMGQVSQDELTELPPEYRELEAKVDALANAHKTLQKVAKAYATETYDYPTQIQESIVDISVGVSATVTNFAAANLQGTNLPAPAPVQPKSVQHKTLPHALYRASSTAADHLFGNDNKLKDALIAYSNALEKIADARVQQDRAIKDRFLRPWEQTLETNIGVAMKARRTVNTSRLELDAAKQTLKTAGPANQDAARFEVENAEDDLVQKTEVAIQLMKTVLDNPEPIENLCELMKAQFLFHDATAKALSASLGEIDGHFDSAEA